MDIDIWIERTPENVRRVWDALASFGAPLDSLGMAQTDLAREDVVAQLGLPPHRIDILTGVTGLTFESAWRNRVQGTIEGIQVPVLGLRDLVVNKLATGRAKDRGDVEGLEGK